ncbi:MAG TPA: ribulose-phosphate 3-epimerase [Anaerolineales bacterium]|nr:ribulose-phosphate 3-epimerase [Anaerolineales bacterium]
MKNRYLIAPSIVSADFLRLKESIAACEAAGADWIHVDVMDGHFVPNITMGPFLVATFKRATGLPLDVHLMIEQPERYLEAFARAGADHLTVHVETCPRLPETLKQIKSLGCLAGVTLNPATPVSAIEEVLPLADLVLVLSVNPGFSGQTFMPETVSKVAQARQKLDEIHSSAYLEVDGGISVESLPKMKEAGADVFVSATAIFSHPNGIEAGISTLRMLL